MNSPSTLSPLWVPWPSAPVPPPVPEVHRRSRDEALAALRHPWAALRRRFAALPLPWRRRVLGLLPRLRRPTLPPPAGEWLAELPGLPPARPVLLLTEGQGFPAYGEAGGEEWAVVSLAEHPMPSAEDAGVRALLSQAAGSPHPIGCVLGHRRERGEAAARLARTLGWPAAGAENPGSTLFQAVPALFPPLSVVVVVYRHPELTQLCLEALRRWTAWPHLEVLVVDNASPDGAAAAARAVAQSDCRIRVIENVANVGFARAANQGVAASRGEVIALLNHDVVVSPGWEVPLLQHLMAHPQVGLAGPSTNAAGNEARVRARYRTLGEFRAFAWEQATVRRRPWAMADLGFFCLAVRRQVWEQLGGLDEGYGLGYFEDADFCWRARAAGWRLACLRDSFVHHWQGAAFNALPEAKLEALWEANRQRFLARRRRSA